MITDKIFLNIAREISKGSKCISRQVWAIIVKDGRILSTWYNGTPAWYINCKDFWNGEYISWAHHDWATKYEIHSEMNAILWAARNWVAVDWATIYCTYQPCYECTKNIIWAWIKKIVYWEKYKHYTSSEAEDFIKDNDIEIIHIG